MQYLTINHRGIHRVTEHLRYDAKSYVGAFNKNCGNQIDGKIKERRVCGISVVAKSEKIKIKA